MINHTFNIIESSREEYAALSEAEWRKDYFNEENGGFMATHIYKERDDLRRSGIAAEVRACFFFLVITLKPILEQFILQ